MNFNPTSREASFFAGAPKRNLFWKRRTERLLALDQDDVEEGETQAEAECETDEDCDPGCECSEEGECECDGEDSVRELTVSDYSEEQPRDETGKWTSGEGGSTSAARVYDFHVGGQPAGQVEVVPLTKELYDKHVAHMTSSDPLAVPRVTTPAAFEKVTGKGFTEAAFKVTPQGTKVFWMLGKKGFTPRADGAELRQVK